MSRRALATAFTSVILAAGGGCTAGRGPEAGDAAPNNTERPVTAAPYESPALPHIGGIAVGERVPDSAPELAMEWVDVTPGTSADSAPVCYVDMRHTLAGPTIESALGGTVGTPCEAGDSILPDQLPQDFNETLKENRRTFELLLGGVATQIKDGVGDVEASVTNRHEWVGVVGTVSPGPNGGHEPHLTDGEGDRAYGHGICSVKRGMPVTLMGAVSYYDHSYTVGILGPVNGGGAVCESDTVLLLDLNSNPAV